MPRLLVAVGRDAQGFQTHVALLRQHSPGLLGTLRGKPCVMSGFEHPCLAGAGAVGCSACQAVPEQRTRVAPCTGALASSAPPGMTLHRTRPAPGEASASIYRELCLHLLRTQQDRRAEEMSCSSRALAGQIKLSFSVITMHQPAHDGKHPFHTTNLLVFEMFPLCQKTHRCRAGPGSLEGPGKVTKWPQDTCKQDQHR